MTGDWGRVCIAFLLAQIAPSVPVKSGGIMCPQYNDTSFVRHSSFFSNVNVEYYTFDMCVCIRYSVGPRGVQVNSARSLTTRVVLTRLAYMCTVSSLPPHIGSPAGTPYVGVVIGSHRHKIVVHEIRWNAK